MIVKNESRVILRLLESLAPLLDGYCICDTGSTDNTIEIIRTFFQNRGIPGKIVEEPFRDFGYNRTFALKACEDLAFDYLLLLDADMVLTGPALQQPDKFKSSLSADMYHLYQGNPKFYYKNARMIRNKKGFTYWGVTHEYVNAPPNTSVGTIERDLLFISDIGDGGAKGDKTERDIRLLKKGLEEIPNNDRYLFYLANSYHDAGQHQNAIDTYRKRIEVGGWIEEIWYSHYRIGNCYMQMGEEERAICAWMQGYNAYPNRIENLFKIVEYYRVRGKNKIAYEFYWMADKSRKKYTNWSDYLFFERDIYDYKLDYEWTILGYYVNEKGMWTNELVQSCMKVLNYPHLENHIYRNVMNNYKFYVSSVGKSEGVKKEGSLLWTNLLKGIGSVEIDGDEYVSSTPSVAWLNEQWIVNVRYVNYRIDGKGGYVNREQIRTINVLATVNDGKVETSVLGYNMEEDGRYVGLEDVRLHSQNGVLYYNANRGLKNGAMVVEHGVIDLQENMCKGAVHLKPVNSGPVVSGFLEKNWVLFEGSVLEKPKMVYGWWPLVMGEVEGEQFVETIRDTNVPACFKDLRGSTNGVVIDGDIWFFCHAVSYEDRRYYYHMVVVLDGRSMKVKKYTPFFTFEKEKVEYTLGFSYLEKEDELLVGYSLYDKETKYVVLDKKYLENQMMVFSS